MTHGESNNSSGIADNRRGKFVKRKFANAFAQTLKSNSKIRCDAPACLVAESSLIQIGSVSRQCARGFESQISSHFEFARGALGFPAAGLSPSRLRYIASMHFTAERDGKLAGHVSYFNSERRVVDNGIFPAGAPFLAEPYRLIK